MCSFLLPGKQKGRRPIRDNSGWVREGRRPEPGTSYTAGAHKIPSGEGPGRLDGEKGNSGGDQWRGRQRVDRVNKHQGDQKDPGAQADAPTSLVLRATPPPRAELKAADFSEGAGGRNPQLSGQETRVHCPGAGTAWSEGEGRPVCWVWGAAWPLRPMTHCPPSVLTVLPASLVLSPCSPPFSPVVWGRRDDPTAGTETLTQDLGWAWVGAEGEGQTEAEKGEPGQSQLYSGENTGLWPQQRGRKRPENRRWEGRAGEQVGRDRDRELERGREMERWRETERGKDERQRQSWKEKYREEGIRSRERSRHTEEM